MPEAGQTFGWGRGRGQKSNQGQGARGRGRGKEYPSGDRGGRKGNRGKLNTNDSKESGNESESIFINDGYEDFDSETDREKGKTNDSRAVRFAENTDGHVKLAALKESRERERADLIRKGIIDDPNNPKPLSEALTFVGTCMEMCPLYEREERQFQKSVDKLEIDPVTGLIDPKRAVKSFHRPAAGNEAALPSDVRPPAVLVKTLDYLINNIVGTSSSLMSSHSFVRDRTRGIRQDFTLQNYRGRETIECSERIARYHILCIHQLIQDDRFVLQQELEQLKKTMTTLNELYDDAAKDDIDCPNEPEFLAYYLVLFLHVEDIQRRIPKRHFFDSNRQIQAALKLHYSAFTNASKFFKQMSSPDVTYLMACVANVHFFDIRRAHLKKALLGYNKDAATLMIAEVAQQLGFDHKTQVIELCEYLGMETAKNAEGEEYIVIKRTWDDSRPPMKPLFNKRIVQAKRKYGAWRDIINATLPRTAKRGPFEEEEEEDEEEEVPVDQNERHVGPPSPPFDVSHKQGEIGDKAAEGNRGSEIFQKIPSNADYFALDNSMSDQQFSQPAHDFYQDNPPSPRGNVFSLLSDHQQQSQPPSGHFSYQPSRKADATTPAQPRSVFSTFGLNQGNIPAAFAVGSSNATFTNTNTIFGAPSRSSSATPPTKQDVRSSQLPNADLAPTSAVSPATLAATGLNVFKKQQMEKYEPGRQRNEGQGMIRQEIMEIGLRGPAEKLVEERAHMVQERPKAAPTKSISRNADYHALNPTASVFQPVSSLTNSALFAPQRTHQNVTNIPVQRDTSGHGLFPPTALPAPRAILPSEVATGGGVFGSAMAPLATTKTRISDPELAEPEVEHEEPKALAPLPQLDPQSLPASEVGQALQLLDPEELLGEFSLYVETKMRDLVRSPNLRARALVLSELKKGLAEAMESCEVVDELQNIVADAITRTRLVHGTLVVWRAVIKARQRTARMKELNEEKRRSLKQKENGLVEHEAEQWIPVRMKVRPGINIVKEATLFRDFNYDEVPLADILAYSVDRFLQSQKLQNTPWTLYALNAEPKAEYWWLRKFGISTGAGLTTKSIEKKLSSGNVFRVERVMVEPNPPTDAGALIFGCRASFNISNAERFEMDKRDLHLAINYALSNSAFQNLALLVVCYRSPLDDTDANPLAEDDPRCSKEGRKERLKSIHTALAMGSLPERVVGKQIILVETLQDLNLVPAMRSLAKSIDARTMTVPKRLLKKESTPKATKLQEKQPKRAISPACRSPSLWPSPPLVANGKVSKRRSLERKLNGSPHGSLPGLAKGESNIWDMGFPTQLNRLQKKRQSIPKVGMKTDYFALKSRGVVLDLQRYPTPVNIVLAQRRDKADLPFLTRAKSPELADYEEDEIVYAPALTRKRSRDSGDGYEERIGMSPSKRRLSATSSSDIQERPAINCCSPYDFDNDPIILQARRVMSAPYYHPEAEYPELKHFNSDAVWAS